MDNAASVTAEQLLRMPDDGFRYELVSGVLRKAPPGGWIRGIVGGQLLSLLAPHVSFRSRGRMPLTGTGFLLAHDPDTVRVPAIAFIARERLTEAPSQDGFWPGAPDLVVEVVSPGDRQGEVDEKIQTWLDAGARIVWVVNPKWRNVTVYRSAADVKVLTADEELSGEDVLSGFGCRVDQIFIGL